MLSFASMQPIAIAEGRGATVEDADGRKYIDCYAGISIVNAGHCHHRIVKAIKDQAERLLHCCSYVYHNLPASELSARLAEIAPRGLQKTFLGNSGAEANETALNVLEGEISRIERES